jgi:hypothetical protein
MRMSDYDGDISYYELPQQWLDYLNSVVGKRLDEWPPLPVDLVAAYNAEYGEDPDIHEPGVNIEDMFCIDKHYIGSTVKEVMALGRPIGEEWEGQYW